MSAWEEFLQLPWFDASHRELAQQAQAWAVRELPALMQNGAVDLGQRCRALVRALAQAGYLQHLVRQPDGSLPQARVLCLLREVLATQAPLADFALAMQALGSAPISLFGNAQQQAHYLPPIAAGQTIAAFALSEAAAGSDVAGMQCQAQTLADGVLLQGEKCWISNAGIADLYIVFAREAAQITPATRGSRDISAFIVHADQAGMKIGPSTDLLAPHPMASLHFVDCFVPQAQRLGMPGQGFKIAMASLDLLRSSVAAAALGMARQALACALPHVQQRAMFGQHLADLQITQAKLAQMAAAIDSSALLTYRAAWLRDQGQAASAEVALAKWQATEQAQMVIDQALQMFGAAGLVASHPLACLYREIRALRIYEGASEVQQVIIARHMLAQREA